MVLLCCRCPYALLSYPEGTIYAPPSDSSAIYAQRGYAGKKHVVLLRRMGRLSEKEVGIYCASLSSVQGRKLFLFVSFSSHKVVPLRGRQSETPYILPRRGVLLRKKEGELLRRMQSKAGRFFV